MQRILAALIAGCLLVVTASGCCVASGYQKAACKDACEKADTQQKTTCASMTGAAKTTCEEHIKTSHDTCLKACDP